MSRPEVEQGGWRQRAEDAWRVLGVGLLLAGAYLVFLRLDVVILPLFAGVLLATLLAPFVEWQHRRGMPEGLAALLSILGVVLVVLALVAGAVALAVDGADRIGQQLSDSADQVTDWLVEGPLDLDRADVEEARDDLGQEAGDAVRAWARGGGLARSTTTAVEVLAGMVLMVLSGFFLLKDRDLLGRWALGLWREDRRARVRATTSAAVDGLRGYLRGCLILGSIEGVVIGAAVAIFASPSLGAPVGIFTLVAAFFPVVGAVVAGALAVAVTLAQAGFLAALIVGIVALVVQQLDNDVLGPYVLGRATRLHPLAILVGITAGSALAGLAGAFVAVPLTSAATAAHGAWRRDDEAESDSDDDSDGERDGEGGGSEGAGTAPPAPAPDPPAG